MKDLLRSGWRGNRSARFCVLVLLGLFTSSACSTNAASPATQSAQGDQVCTMEKPLGSQIPKRVCRSRAQVEAQQTSAAETLRDQVKRTTPIGESAQ